MDLIVDACNDLLHAIHAVQPATAWLGGQEGGGVRDQREGLRQLQGEEVGAFFSCNWGAFKKNFVDFKHSAESEMAKSKPLVGSLAWVLSSIVKQLLSSVPNKGANELLYSSIMTP